jgi:hypothetical protein
MVCFIKIPSYSLELAHLLVLLAQIQLIDVYMYMCTYMHTYVGGWDSHDFWDLLKLTYIVSKNLY